MEIYNFLAIHADLVLVHLYADNTLSSANDSGPAAISGRLGIHTTSHACLKNTLSMIGTCSVTNLTQILCV